MATVRESHRMAWWRELPPKGKRALVGAFLGFGLDSYDFWVLPLSLAAIGTTFGLNSADKGWLATTTLLTSAVGGVAAGVLCDKIGRTRTLMITIITYAVFTALCGLAPNYETLLVLRALQGVGFGGEWATGAILVAEYASARHRGRAVAVIQSSWAVGWGAAVLVYTLVFNLAGDETAWRVLFLTGLLPALAVIYVRSKVEDAPHYTQRRELAARGSLKAIFQGPLGKTTLFASLLATGCQGGYYTIATWLPSYLKNRGLSVIGTGGYLFFLIAGAFLGYLTGGYLTDRLGRRTSFQIFAFLSGVLLILYTRLPASAGTAVMYLGFPLGFCASAIFSGFGSYLAELYPTTARGAGQSFTYNFGRAVGAFFPTVIGYLAGHYGTGGAMTFGALAYALAFVSVLGLPETRGHELS
ncbi:MAG TPA: MFS transporter [Actinophytocola sp.]|jgi:MFS family permease|uniref:MFS transporter n=1 Tax=Actinophytocola sp. TaxID=1872138 RepID=UPI002E07E8C9|nr:MFS transporter [Actinophytocola sp.]